MDHDDFIAETAMYEVVVALNSDKSIDMIYSDEDRMAPGKRRHQPYFKPDFNIDLMFGHNMFSHMGVYRRSLVESVGGFREGVVDGSQDYDLTLRCAAKTDRIHHIPTVLYHWRLDPEKGSFSQSQLDRCVAAARRAISDYLHSKNIKGAKVGPAKLAAEWSRVIWPLPVPSPKVSIIIPTRDKATLLAQCVNGVLLGTEYDNFEIVIVDNGSREDTALFLLEKYSKMENIKVLSFPGAFNYSAINNFAVSEADGDVILLLNNDTGVKDKGWLREMVSLVSRTDVGVVGAKLLYGDGRIQHAGVVVGVGTDAVAGHFGHYDDENSGGYIGQYALTREVSAVTGACLAVKRDLYLELGGLDAENLPISYNDVDFCLRVREHGLKVIWTPFAELYHFESASRGSDEEPDKNELYRKSQSYMRQRWHRELEIDPFYNPNFDYSDHNFRLATPTRRKKPWEGS
jgi:GT2 family glycosyltransferase